MKSQKVILSVSGSVQGEENEGIRLMTTGLLSGGDPHWKLRYNETLPDGEMSHHVTVSMDEGVVTMQRDGMFATSMVFEKGHRFEGSYNTPFGSIDMGVFPTRVNYHVNEGAGEVNLQYQLDLRGQFEAMHELSIRFAPGAGKS